MSTRTSEMTLLENRVFADVITWESGDEISLDLGWALNLMTGDLIRRGEDTERQRKRPSEDRQKLELYGYNPRNAGDHRSWKRHGRVLS